MDQDTVINEWRRKPENNFCFVCTSFFGNHNKTRRKKKLRMDPKFENWNFGREKMIERVIISFLTFGKCLTRLFFALLLWGRDDKSNGSYRPSCTFSYRWETLFMEVAKYYLESHVWTFQTYPLRFKVSISKVPTEYLFLSNTYEIIIIRYSSLNSVVRIEILRNHKYLHEN